MESSAVVFKEVAVGSTAEEGGATTRGGVCAHVLAVSDRHDVHQRGALTGRDSRGRNMSSDLTVTAGFKETGNKLTPPPHTTPPVLQNPVFRH